MNYFYFLMILVMFFNFHSKLYSFFKITIGISKLYNNGCIAIAIKKMSH